MEGTRITLFLAFSAGVLSFVSPCILPLVPVYLSYLTERAVTLQDANAPRRWITFLHALGFVLGFSVVFTFLGASVGLVGYLFYDLQPIIQKVGGLILVVFGLHTIGVLKIPFLYREMRLEANFAGRWGVISSFLVGAVFAAGWTPCVGPILSGILVLAGTSGTVAQGALLLFVYSLGLGIPFLIAGMSLAWSNALLKRLRRYGGVVSVLSGVLLIAMGVLIFTNTLSVLTAYLLHYLGPLL